MTSEYGALVCASRAAERYSMLACSLTLSSSGAYACAPTPQVFLYRMQPDRPQDLCRRVVQHLNSQSQKPAASNNFSTVCEGLQRDLWVDYLADSGDSSVCSAIMASMIFAEYDLPDIATGSRLLAPRGDILMFGGDTACELAQSIATLQCLFQRIRPSCAALISCQIRRAIFTS